METGSLEQAGIARRHRWRTAAWLSGFLLPLTPRLGVPGGSHAGWLRRSAHSRSLAYRLSSAGSIGLHRAPHPPWEGRYDDVPPMTRRTATDGGDEQMFGAE